MRTILSTVLALMAAPAFAHHPLDGAPMRSFADGLLSGVGHTVIGLDHLVFVIGLGIAAQMLHRPTSLPLLYLVAMLGGLVLAPLPAIEPAIAISLLLLGSALVLKTPRWLMPGAAALGLFHGAAFAGAILGQEGGAATPVWVGYALSLCVVQFAIARLAAAAARARPALARPAGTVIACVGLFVLLQMAAGPVLAMIAG